MKNLLLTVLVVIFGICAAYSQSNLEKISWSQSRPLNWIDFRAEADTGSHFQASSNTGISYSWGLESTNGVVELEYRIFSNFYPDLSWVAPGSDNQYLLSHEQLHFDITELHARKLRKRLAELSVNRLGKDPRKTLNSFYEEVDKERRSMQERYDKETRHSLNKEAEMHWQKYVQEELKKFRAYAQ